MSEMDYIINEEEIPVCNNCKLHECAMEHGYLCPIIDNHIPNDKRKFCNRKTTRVAKLSLDGTVLTIYDSIKAAAAANNIAPQNISHALHDRRKHTGGFLWKKVEETNDTN